MSLKRIAITAGVVGIVVIGSIGVGYLLGKKERRIEKEKEKTEKRKQQQEKKAF